VGQIGGLPVFHSKFERYLGPSRSGKPAYEKVQKMKTTETPVVGIDVSKRKLDVALLVDGKVKSKVVENSSKGYVDLAEWMVKHKVLPAEVHVCMESTGIYSEPVALGLQNAGFQVSVVNPSCIKGFGRSENVRNKNDNVDAGLIARYCASARPQLWEPPPLEQRQLRAWSDRLLALKDMRQQELNRIEAHEFIGQSAIVAHVRSHVNWLEVQIGQLEKDISDHIDRHPGLKGDVDLITTIPGLGRVTAAKVIGHLGDIRRFKSAKALAAFIGVSPGQRTSGTSVRGRTSMCRIGNTSLRAALFMPGLVARRHNPLLNPFAERLLANGMAKKAVIGAVMRKLVHLIYGVIKSGKPFDPNFLDQRLAIQDGI
jgi:transposase